MPKWDFNKIAKQVTTRMQSKIRSRVPIMGTKSSQFYSKLLFKIGGWRPDI